MIFDVKLTSACDSKCLNCHIWASKVVHLSFFRTLDILDRFKTDEFIFSGGEPLLHPDIYEIIEFAVENDINFLILSNGIDYDRIEKAVQIGAKRITLSVDGYNHDNLRGVKGNLQTIKKILRLLSHKADFRLAYTISEGNDLENDTILLDELIALGANANVYFAIAQQVKSFNVKENKRVKILKIPLHLERYKCMSSTTRKYLSRYPKPIKHCYSPQFYISIYEDGKVRYCQSYDFNFVLGNVCEDSLPEILSESEWIRGQSDNCPFKNKCWLACHRRYDVKSFDELQKIGGII